MRRCIVFGIVVFVILNNIGDVDVNFVEVIWDVGLESFRKFNVRRLVLWSWSWSSSGNDGKGKDFEWYGEVYFGCRGCGVCVGWWV